MICGHVLSKRRRGGRKGAPVGMGIDWSESMDREQKLDRHDARLLGVCARLADWADVDPRLVRLNAVLLGLLLAPVILPGYLVAGLLLGRRTLAC